MLAFVMVSLAAASAGAATPQTTQTAQLDKQPTRFCREMFKSSSRVYSVKVCKTRAEWRRWEACHGSATRYCTPKKKAVLAGATLGNPTAFPLNEDSRIICRMVKVTGTRLLEQQACLPRREWERMWKESAAATQKMIQDHSTRPGKTQ